MPDQTQFEQWIEDRHAWPFVHLRDVQEGRLLDDLPHNPEYRAYMLSEEAVG